MIGSRIKKARKDIGISQKALADILGLKTQSVQQWESGKTSPRLHRVIQLSDILKVSFSWLQTGSETNAFETKFEADNTYDATLLKSAFLNTLHKLSGLQWVDVIRKDIPNDALGDIFLSEHRALLDNQIPENKKGV